MTKIYTRTGDKGKTSLFGGKRVSKANIRVEAYGSIDELHAAVAVAKAHLKDESKEVEEYLYAIQNDLFTLASIVANPSGNISILLSETIKEMENRIDVLTEKLPVLNNFIFCDGGPAGSSLHLARAICRRVERRLVALDEIEKQSEAVMMYFNRLSDYLFTLARFVNFKEAYKEKIWSSKSR